jgi:hypothetical protein
VRRADNLTTFMCRLSRNLGASSSWNPKGLSRPVMGLLFFLPFPADACTHNWHVNFGNIMIIEKNIFSGRYISLECENSRGAGIMEGGGGGT